MLKSLRLWRVDSEAVDDSNPMPDSAAHAADPGAAASADSATRQPPRLAVVRALPQGDVYIDAIDRAPLQAWLATVPAPVRPAALAGIYPRIVKKIMRLWDDRVGLLAYMDELVTDRRGGRIGFPPKVEAELLRLHEFIRLRMAAQRAR